MTEQEHPQIYLITPPEIELSSFPATLDHVLGGAEIACLRLALATSDEDRLSRAADACREVAFAHDVAIVIDDHVMLAERLGLDGVHLTDGARNLRSARKRLGPDAIVGAFCGTSRHDGMSAGEAGADYISFGPAGATSLGDGRHAEADLFHWWSEMIELPVVAEGALDATVIKALAPATDFFGIREIWETPDPLATLQAFSAAMR